MPTTTPAAELVARLNAEDPTWLIGDDAQRRADLEHQIRVLADVLAGFAPEIHQLQMRFNERAAKTISEHDIEGFDPLMDLFDALGDDTPDRSTLAKLRAVAKTVAALQ